MKSAKSAKSLGTVFLFALSGMYVFCSAGAVPLPSQVAADARNRVPLVGEAMLSWFDLLLFVAESVCQVVDCNAAPIGDRSNTAEEAESIVQGVINAYADHGVNSSLTPAQAQDGIATVDGALWLLDDPNSLLTPELTEEFRTTLASIRADLVGIAGAETGQ